MVLTITHQDSINLTALPDVAADVTAGKIVGSWWNKSLNITGILDPANGGTNNAFTAFTGPSASTKTFTLPNASDIIACLGQANTWTTQQTFNIAAPIFATMTAGSVLFAGSSGLLSQDNSNLFYDDLNNRLGIGTNTPGSGLIYGALNTAFHNFSTGLAITATQSTTGAALTYTEGVGNSIVAIADSSASSNFKILDILSSGGKMIFRRLTDAYSSALANALTIDYTAGDHNGYIGINTTTPATRVNIIDTEDFRIGHTGATGDLLAGMAMYTASGNTNLSIFGNGSAGGNTGTLQLIYTGGSGGNTFYSAVEIQNTASGFGNLRLMKSGGTVTVGGTVNITGLTASQAVFTDGSSNLISVAVTGSGSVVRATSPTLVTPLLGTPTSGILTNCTGTASGLTAGNVTTNANLTGALTSVGNATTLITAIPFSAPSTVAVGNATTYLMAKAPFSGTINTLLAAQTTSGTITAAIKINGTNVTGLSAVAVTSTPADTNATAANTFAVGDIITLVTSSASTDLGLSFVLKITRT